MEASPSSHRSPLVRLTSSIRTTDPVRKRPRVLECEVERRPTFQVTRFALRGSPAECDEWGDALAVRSARSPPDLRIDVGLLRPRSRGSIRVRSADPAAPRPPWPLSSVRRRATRRGVLGWTRSSAAAGDATPLFGTALAESTERRTCRSLIRANSYSFRTLSRRARWDRAPKTAPSSTTPDASTARAAQRRRCLDHPEPAVGVCAPPAGHARRTALGADRVGGLSATLGPRQASAGLDHPVIIATGPPRSKQSAPAPRSSAA